ncbi:MAG: HAD-IA family hydrolase [Pseudomonadota bacterium]
MQAVVFDCDGTLADSHHVIVEAMTRAFEKSNLPPPDDAAVRRVIGLSLPIAIAQLAQDIAPDYHATLVDAYKTSFHDMRSSGAVHEALYPRVRACLLGLQNLGVALGIATGKSKRGLAHLLDTHDLRGFFGSLQTADDNPSKPNPHMLEAAMLELGATPQDTVMVGDSPYDIEMALAAGTRAIGVAWSDHGAQALIAAGAHDMLAGYDDWSVLL